MTVNELIHVLETLPDDQKEYPVHFVSGNSALIYEMMDVHVFQGHNVTIVGKVKLVD